MKKCFSSFLIIFIFLVSQSSLKADKLFIWGWNEFGQIGDGTTNDRYSPAMLGTDTTWVQADGSQNHTMAIKRDGSLWAWGANYYGELGDGTQIDRNTPVQIGNETNWKQVRTCMWHTAAIKKDGTLWAWGQNDNGQVGDGTTIERHSPVQIGTDNNWVQIDCGYAQTFALKSDGTLWAWGNNTHGQLGDGTTTERHSPIKIGTATNWSKFASGHFCNFAIKSDGTLWAWGVNLYGVLGDGTTTNKTTPIQIGTGTNWSNVSCFLNYATAIKTDGTIWAWGHNEMGQLGDGTTIEKHSPNQIGTGTNWTQVACGYYHTLAIQSDGTLWSWGFNHHGELGDGTTTNKYTPIQIGNETTWTNVAAGAYHSMAFNTSSCDILTSTPKDIDFGDRTCLADTTIKIIINNIMKTPVEVTETIFAKGANSKLSVINGGTFTIAGNDSRQLTISIKTTSTGIINDTLIIIYPTGCDTIRIPIKGIRDTIGFTLSISDTLFWGRTCPNVPLDTIIKVKNISSKATKLIRNNIVSPFSIIGTDPFATIFNLNETKNLHIRFMSANSGIFYQDIIISDTCGKSTKIVIKVEIHEPQVEAGPDQTICLRDTLTIGNPANSGTPPYKYKWTPGSGLSDENTAITKASPTTSTIYYLTVIDSIGCTTIDSIKIIVNPLPNPVITGLLSVCENQSYVYTTNTPLGTSSHWTVTGATSVDSSTKDKLIIVWGKSGTGRITLNQTIASTGCHDSVFIDVVINAMPKPDISVNKTVCVNSTNNYFTTQTGTINHWTVTGGNILGNAYSNSVDVNWTDAGLAYIKLVQSYPSGCKDSIEMEIVVNPSPIVNLDDNIFLCIDTTYTLDPKVSSGKKPWSKIQWTPATGLSDPNILNPKVSLTTSGTYKYILTVTDANGCVGEDSINIIVHPQPNLLLSKDSLDFGTLDPCQSSKDDSVEITNTGTENMIVDEYSFKSGFSIVSPPIPFLLKPGEKRTVVVRYIAANIGQVSDDIIISGSPCKWIKTVNCKANKSEMYIKSNPNGIDFGQSLSCLPISKDSIIILTNTGTSDITIYFGSITLNLPFTIISPKTSRVIAPKDTVHVLIHYEPNIAGNYSEDIRIPFEAGTCKDTLKIALSGIHINPKMSSSLRNIVFPDIMGCDPSRDTTITIQNTGTIDVVIVGVEPDTIFSTSGNNTTIPAGESIDLKIKFSPKSTGFYSGILIIRYEPCGNADTVIVSGNKQGVMFVVSDSLNFGDIVFCQEKIISKSLPFTIENRSSSGIDGAVKSLVQISNPFSTTLKSGDSILNGKIYTYNVAIDVDSSLPDGEITGTLDFMLSPCDSLKSVKLRIKKTSVNLVSTNSLNFGNVNIGTSKIDTIRIKNTGTADVQISSINNIISPFVLINTIPSLPATLKPNEELLARICYTPNDDINDTLTIKINAEPCNISKDAILMGQTSQTKYVLRTCNMEGYPGNIIEVPIILENLKNIQSTGITAIKTDLSFNGTLLLPLDYTMIKVNEKSSYITLNNLLLKKAIEDTLTKVKFEVGLGNEDVCDLAFSNVETIGGSADISIINGKFKLLGVCPEGGKRLLNPTGTINITSIKPNPSDNEITVEMEIVESTGYKFSIVNSNGQIVKEISKTNTTKGITTVKISVSDLASGVYNLILQTESERISKMFLIMK